MSEETALPTRLPPERDDGDTGSRPGPAATPATGPSVTAPVGPGNRPRFGRRVLFAPIQFLWGMLFCQSVLGALVILGWTNRLAQRAVLKQWWRCSADRAAGFAAYVAGDDRTAGHAHFPNWFLEQDFGRAVRGNGARPGPARLVRALFGSLWGNARLGVQSIFNTWVLTLPACALMLFGWYDGWNNSFNKGYEQFWVGPAVSWLGILLFMAAMLYVPLAQARQAVTGDWRAFYQFRLVWTLVRRRWLAGFGLATLYALSAVPLTILSSVVMFLPNIRPDLADAPPAQLVRVVDRYYFWSALYVFPVFVGLRLVGARIYGSALLKAVQSGAVAQDALGENEWRALHRLKLLHGEPPRIRHPLVRLAAWAGTRAGRATFGFLTVLVWFLFVFQTYLAQFFHYSVGPTVWLNRPWVQLPWFHHVPATFKNPWSDFLVAGLVVFAAWRLAKVARWVGRIRKGRADGARTPGPS